MSEEKPKDCYECQNFGQIKGITHFPSLCKKNLLWFDCGGKEGIKKEKKSEEKIDLEELEKEGLIQDIQMMSDSLTEDGFSEEEVQEAIDDSIDEFYNKKEDKNESS